MAYCKKNEYCACQRVQDSNSTKGHWLCEKGHSTLKCSRTLTKKPYSVISILGGLSATQTDTRSSLKGKWQRKNLVFFKQTISVI